MWGLSFSGLVLIFAIHLWASFDNSLLGFQKIINLPLLSEYNFSLMLGVDGFSLIFLLLTAFLFPICFLASSAVHYAPKQFIAYLLLLEILLILTFTCLDLFFFYVFFESLLIPMFIIIGE